MHNIDCQPDDLDVKISELLVAIGDAAVYTTSVQAPAASSRH